MKSDKREKAIKYLTEEIRSLRMAPKINGCGPENWAEQLEIMETCLEAVRSAHFADAGKMQPLNFEQLWKMDGQPVRIVCDEAAKETTPGFEPLEMIVLVEYIKTAGCVILRNNIGGVSEYYSDEELQQDGLTAYAYPQAHIDRDAWVNVRERLPEKEGWYLVYAPGYHGNSHIYGLSGLAYSKFDPNYKRHWGIERGTGGGWAGIITHWMPLPEPPDELEKRLRG